MDVVKNQAYDESFLKSLLKGIGYILLYELVLMAAITIFVVFCILFGNEIVLGDSADANVRILSEWADKHQDLLVITSNIAAIFVFLGINRRNTQFKELLTKKITGKTLLLIVGVGVFLAVAVTYIRYLFISFGVVAVNDSSVIQINSSNFLIRLLRSAIIAPVLEELVFRGTVFLKMKRGMSVAMAAVFSSILFGVAHFSGIFTAVYAVINSLIIIYVICRTASLTTGIILHSVYNFTCIILLFFPASDVFAYYMIPLGCIAVAVLLMIFKRENSNANSSINLS